METPIPTLAEAEKLNITSKEFDQIKEILQRNPSAIELEIFSTLWSEHACYKNSIHWLKTLPTNGEKVLVEAGAESAGAIDLGNGLACVVKVETHNHPCAIQPRLGANTGLRLLSRDIASMGAKPMAILNSLRFGEGKRDTAKWLFEEVANGMSEFEKGYNVPIVGGETFFSKGYNSSPVVNNFAFGVVDKNKLLSGVAKGEGNLILIIGALTGKDGVDSDVFTDDVIAGVDVKSVPLELLMDVSVEKHLQEAIEELNDKGHLLGAQTIGNQGIIGAACEMSVRGTSGLSLHMDKVPLRENDLNAREILLAQTWSRMLVCITPENFETVKKVADSKQLAVGILGEVVGGDNVVCHYNGDVIADIPSKFVGMGGEAPVYELKYGPVNIDAVDINIEQYDEPDHYPDVIKEMLVNLNVTSKKWMTDKFDESIKTEGSNQRFPSDSAFVDIEGTNQAIAATMDCNSSYMKTDANIGAQIAVAEAARNIICGGGIPLGVSDCLNYGNPFEEEVYGTFVDSIIGITKACNDFNLPVLSGNVSFFNQHSEGGQLKAITPTPVIGMVGLVEDKRHHSTLSFRHKGDMIFLIGQSRNDVNSSEFASSVLNIKYSLPPYYDFEEEKELQDAVAGMIREGLVRSVHDVSNGGLFFTLLESGIPLEFGFDITSDAEIRKEAFLFGESQSRVVVSVSPAKQDEFVDFMIEKNVPFSILGHVTKGEIRIDDEAYGFIGDMKKDFEQRLEQWVLGK